MNTTTNNAAVEKAMMKKTCICCRRPLAKKLKSGRIIRTVCTLGNVQHTPYDDGRGGPSDDGDGF